MSESTYIGLATTYHDSAIAIVDHHGEIQFAEATERHLQNKRAINCPADLVHRTAELIERFVPENSDIVVAHSWSARMPTLLGGYLKAFEAGIAGLRQAYSARPPPYLHRNAAAGRFAMHAQLRAGAISGLGLELELASLERDVDCVLRHRRYEHHLTHAAAAAYTSPFEEAVCAIIDGFGEERAFAYYHYSGGRLTEIPPTSIGENKGSLGVFYETVCEACGFDRMGGEEWKVMGLAAYGQYDEELYRLFREMISVQDLNIVVASPMRQAAQAEKLEKVRRRRGCPVIEAANLAYAGQKVFTEVLYQLLRNLAGRQISHNLVLGGGCALNSSASGAILENTGFRDLHVCSAPADDGNALGAALLAFCEDHPGHRPSGRSGSPYLGSSMPAPAMRHLQAFGPLDKMRQCGGAAPRMAAKFLAEGKIIGWVQGRAEFGPRALGNRSILADPRDRNIKDTINERVKFREEFRPLAPSILHDFGAQYFENYQVSRYMERTLRFRPHVRHLVPAVVHEDGTGRVQSVRREWNERFHELISAFHELTNVPLVLNTSFNVMGKPIAHSVEDVLAVFYTSGLDAVFIDDLLIQK